MAINDSVTTVPPPSSSGFAGFFQRFGEGLTSTVGKIGEASLTKFADAGTERILSKVQNEADRFGKRTINPGVSPEQSFDPRLDTGANIESRALPRASVATPEIRVIAPQREASDKSGILTSFGVGGVNQTLLVGGLALLAIALVMKSR